MKNEIKIATKIPLTNEQAQVASDMWNKFGECGGATIGQVHWFLGNYNLHMRILTPTQFAKVNKVIKSFKFKDGIT
jgi:hypothetical protein